MKSLKKTKLEDSLEEREGKWEEEVNGKDKDQDKVLETHSDQDQTADQEVLEMEDQEVSVAHSEEASQLGMDESNKREQVTHENEYDNFEPRNYIYLLLAIIEYYKSCTIHRL